MALSLPAARLGRRQLLGEAALRPSELLLVLLLHLLLVPLQQVQVESVPHPSRRMPVLCLLHFCMQVVQHPDHPLLQVQLLILDPSLLLGHTGEFPVVLLLQPRLIPRHQIQVQGMPHPSRRMSVPRLIDLALELAQLRLEVRLHALPATTTTTLPMPMVMLQLLLIDAKHLGLDPHLISLTIRYPHPRPWTQ